jgi:hypothetical protein
MISSSDKSPSLAPSVHEKAIDAAKEIGVAAVKTAAKLKGD